MNDSPAAPPPVDAQKSPSAKQKATRWFGPSGFIAVGTLAKLGDPRAVEPLMALGERDQDWDIQREVKAALKKLNPT